MDVSYLLDSLNDKQREAVAAPRSNLLVLAGAGSGKTRVLVHRIAWLMSVENCSPYSIMAVTFTNKAAAEMRHRIGQLMGTSQGGMWVGTFHGLAHRLLRAHHMDANLPQDFQILDSEDQLRLLKRLIKAMNLDEKQWPPRQAMWYINSQKDEGLRPHHIQSYGNPVEQTWQKVYQAYQEACDRAGLVDFAELLLRAHELWLNKPYILQHYRERFTNILVDEFQDTSREQWEAIHPLVLEALSRGGSLTWVGDVKQAIYGWRGGDATLFDEVRSDAELCAVAPEPRVDILPTNWRSCRAIVETNNTLFRQLSETATAKAVLSAMLPKDTPSALLATILEEGAQLLKEGFAGSEQKVAPDKAEGFLRLQRVYGDKSEDLDEEVRERLLGCVQEVVSRRPWGDVTVLVRSNGKAAQVAGWLMEEGIPVVTDNSFLLAEHPLVEQITALLTFLDSPRNDLAFWTFLSGRQMLLPLIPLSEQALEDWAAARRTSERRNMPLFMAFREDFPDIWRKWIAPFHADAGLLTPYDVTREALGRLDIWSRYPDEAAFVRRFLEIIHVAEGQGYGSLSSFLDYWNKHGQQEKAPMPETLDAVRVMTMHKSKGLQFPVVIVPWHNFSQRVDSPAAETHVDGLTVLAPRGPASGYAHYKAIADNAREALHLLYVAWTRAEEELHAFLTETSSSRNASGLGSGLNVLLGALPMTEETFETGTPPFVRPAEQARKPKTMRDGKAVAEELALIEPESIPAGQSNERWRPMHWLPRLRIFRNPLEEFSFTQKRRGTFAHHCLACLQTAGQLTGHPEEDARQAFKQGLRTFPLPIRDPETVEHEIVEMLAWYAALPEAGEWLRYGTPEQEIVDESGELYRSDLVVDDGKRITVVEYKTGAPTPAHEIQLQRYMRLISKAAPRPVRGVLVYLDLKRLDYKQLLT